MEAAILSAEERKAALETALADPETYRKEGAGVARLRADLDRAAAEVETLYARWQELEALRSEI
jgi:ATP-binding cassette subfamily F protein uup